MPPKKKAANGYMFAEPLPKGEVLQDLGKKKWKLGISIGKGGFGEIYCAQDVNSSGSKFPYVIKIEPHANGPLFVERSFYINNAKLEDVENFKKEKGLRTLGMPVYIGSGTHEYKNEKYRFLVMEKFGKDLWKLYLENNKAFAVDTVFKVAIQIVDVLEYIHSKGYVHADIKGANILLGTSKDTQDKQVYLVDFGLACKFSTEKELKPNPKKAHDGTIEYLSRDAHLGVQTRRGDMEILAYNIIHWLGCKLPWEGNLKDPKIVQASKEDHMSSVAKMLKACFGTKTPPAGVEEFLKYLKTLNCDTIPDYKKIKTIFTSAVKQAGGSINSPLQFSISKKTPVKRKSVSENDIKGKKQRLLRNRKDINYKDPSTPDSEGLKTIQRKAKKAVQKTVAKKTQKDLSEQESDSETENDEVFEEPKEVSNNTRSQVKWNEDSHSEGETSHDEEPKTVKKRTNKKLLKNYSQKKKVVEESSDREEALKASDEPKEVAGMNNLVTIIGKCLKNGLATEGNSGGESETLEGYTDAMKEIMQKIQNGRSKPKPSKKKPVAAADLDSGDDHMEGYTDEMKNLAAKKKQRTDTKTKKTTKSSAKKENPLLPIATGSRANDKRGLVKETSRRLKKDEPPLTHRQVVTLCDSDSE